MNIENYDVQSVHKNSMYFTLKSLRHRRGFEVQKYLDEKLKAINDFFSTEKLDSCVLGLSGGIDSAVVLALLIDASKQPNSPIKKILGLSLPIFGKGATGQQQSKDKSKILRDFYKNKNVFNFKLVDLTNACLAYQQYESGTHSDFAIGQLLSIVRTPYMYFRAALLQDAGFKSIVCGTTNRDEGGIIGFYGKASDGMNDLQILGDLHKSEVYQLAEYYNLPREIIDDKPRGDVYNGKTDYELIGASYDMVELYTLCLDYDIAIDLLDLTEQELLELNNIKKLIKINSHKYKVGLPARFIDILPRKVKGGWK